VKGDPYADHRSSKQQKADQSVDHERDRQTVTGSNRDEIALRVEETYERLLIGAAVFAHVPSLTAGSVRREVIAHRDLTDSMSAGP